MSFFEVFPHHSGKSYYAFKYGKVFFIALDGGDDGLKFYRALSDNWYAYINKDGYIAMEIGEDQGKDVLSLFVDKAQKAKIIKDAAGLDRVVAIKR